MLLLSSFIVSRTLSMRKSIIEIFINCDIVSFCALMSRVVSDLALTSSTVQFNLNLKGYLKICS